MIEQELFKKSTFQEEQLKKYGFQKENDIFSYSKEIMNNQFQVIITIKDNQVVGRIFDHSFDDEEYTAFRREEIGSFANTIKEEYINILEDIKKHCCKETIFIYNQTNEITYLINQQYGDSPIFKWEDNDAAVFENNINHKWYGLIMPINKNKLDNKTNQLVEVLNIKLDPQLIQELIKKDGFYKAYHMNKTYWITILLDSTIPTQEIMDLINQSYNLVKPKK